MAHGGALPLGAGAPHRGAIMPHLCVAEDIRDKMDEKDKILSDHKKRIDDLEDENIKLLKKDLDKTKEEIKNKPKQTHPRIQREKNEDDTPTIHYY